MNRNIFLKIVVVLQICTFKKYIVKPFVFNGIMILLKIFIFTSMQKYKHPLKISSQQTIRKKWESETIKSPYLLICRTMVQLKSNVT